MHLHSQHTSLEKGGGHLQASLTQSVLLHRSTTKKETLQGGVGGKNWLLNLLLSPLNTCCVWHMDVQLKAWINQGLCYTYFTTIKIKWLYFFLKKKKKENVEILGICETVIYHVTFSGFPFNFLWERVNIVARWISSMLKIMTTHWTIQCSRGKRTYATAILYSNQRLLFILLFRDMFFSKCDSRCLLPATSSKHRFLLWD